MLWVVLAGLLLVGCSSQTVGRPTANSTVIGDVQTDSSITESENLPSASTSDSGGPAIRESKASSPASDASDAPNAADAADAADALQTSVVTVTETAQPSPPQESPAVTVAPSQDFNAPPAIEPAANGFTGFQSPSANIFCAILLDDQGSYVRCDIAEFSYQVPEQPCDGSVGFHAGSAHIDGAAPAAIGGCFGDTVVDPGYPVLEYGQRAVGGDISCTSTEAGMICQNVVSGYGFRLAKASADVF